MSITRFLQQHNALLDAGGSLTISSYDLFVVMDGVECAMHPHLYPTTRFTDSGIRAHILEQGDAGPARVVSIARSWTKKKDPVWRACVCGAPGSGILHV